VRLPEVVALCQQDPAATGDREDEDPNAIMLARSDHHRAGKIQPPRLLLPEVALRRPKLGVGMGGEVIWVSGSIFLV
jgi:hypothetical protein